MFLKKCVNECVPILCVYLCALYIEICLSLPFTGYTPRTCFLAGNCMQKRIYFYLNESIYFNEVLFFCFFSMNKFYIDVGTAVTTMQ